MENNTNNTNKGIKSMLSSFLGTSKTKFENQKMTTPFGDEIIKACFDVLPDNNSPNAYKVTNLDYVPLSEYPRPQLKRDSFLCLNGFWDYAIKKQGEQLDSYDGKILVPFSPESILSGVQRHVSPTDVLYYMREFELPVGFKKDKTILHFGAVDYQAIVKINGNIVGTHKGGFLPFSFDITDFVQKRNVIELEVVDPTDNGVGARGKQKLNPYGIWYTPQSGIWQTVWVESVDKVSVDSVKFYPDIDKKTIAIDINSAEYKKGEIKVSYAGEFVYYSELNGQKHIEIEIENPMLWSPEHPNLYDVEITVGSDRVESYFAMRKFSQIEKNGKVWLALNNEPYLHNGLLDQGYWSDGLLTPPSEESMIYDIESMKELGFNMLRKHIKVEPMRWYYHCDKIGMLVWQDFVNGGGRHSMVLGALNIVKLKVNDKRYWVFSRTDESGRNEYLSEVPVYIDTLFNVCSLAVWVPFNESWGQFDSVKVTDMVRKLDNSRLIDSASGWMDMGAGDMNSQHIYFRAVRLNRDKKRAVVLSEYGGYSTPVKGHYYNEGRIFGYLIFKTLPELNNALEKLWKRDVIGQVKNGLSATVYTQVADVEDECNGMFTFDRKVLKVEKDRMIGLNRALFDEFDRIVK